MILIEDTEEYIKYEDSTGTTYKVPKTNPPTMVVTYDMAARKGFTAWEQIVQELQS